MALDPSIPLSVKGPTFQNPLEAFANVLQVQTARQTMQENTLKLRQQEQAMKDDEALRFTIQQHSKAGGPVDLFAVADTLDQTGFGPVGQRVRMSAIEQQQKWAVAQKDKMDALDKDLTMATRIAKGIRDGSITFDNGVRAIGAIRKEWAAQLGTEFDKDRIDQVIAYGMSASGSVADNQKAVEFAQKAMELSQQAFRDRTTAESLAPQIELNWKKSIASSLAAVQTPEDLAAVRNRYMEVGGVARRLIEMLPDDVTAAKAAGFKLGTTEKERADISGDAATRAETARHNRATEANSREQNAIDRERLGILREQWKKDPANAQNLRNLAEMVINSPDLLKEMNPTLKGDVLKAIAASDDLELKTARQKLTEGTLRGAYDIIQQLKTMPGKAGAVGKPSLTDFGSWQRILPGVDSAAAGSDAANYQQYLATMKSRLTLGQMDLLKGFGHASNADLKVLQDSVTALSTTLSDDQFDKELDKMEQALFRMVEDFNKKEKAQFDVSDPNSSAAATQVPSWVSEALSSRGPGDANFGDGSVWRKLPNGRIVKVK